MCIAYGTLAEYSCTIGPVDLMWGGKELAMGEDGAGSKSTTQKNEAQPPDQGCGPQRDWSTVEIAHLLGCDEPTAQAILALFGLAQDPSTGRWRLEGDQVAALLAGTMQLLLWDRITFGTTTDAAEDLLRELLGERITHLAERNEAPPKPDYGETARRGWEPPP